MGLNGRAWRADLVRSGTYSVLLVLGVLGGCLFDGAWSCSELLDLVLPRSRSQLAGFGQIDARLDIRRSIFTFINGKAWLIACCLDRCQGWMLCLWSMLVSALLLELAFVFALNRCPVGTFGPVSDRA